MDTAASSDAGTGVRAGRAPLPVATVQRIERLVGGDPVVEERIVRFMKGRYGARTLFDLPPRVAAEILRRPADFIRAVKRWCEPELDLRIGEVVSDARARD